MQLGTSFFLCFLAITSAADDAKMGLCEEDRILIKICEFKGYGAKRLMKLF